MKKAILVLYLLFASCGEEKNSNTTAVCINCLSSTGNVRDSIRGTPLHFTTEHCIAALNADRNRMMEQAIRDGKLVFVEND